MALYRSWVAIRQLQKLEETLNRVEYSYCYICMHVWIVRCIELFDIIKSNVLRCQFCECGYMNTSITRASSLPLYSQPKVYAKISGWVHQVFTLDNYNHYISLGGK